MTTATARRRALRYDPPDYLKNGSGDEDRVRCADIPFMTDREIFSERQMLLLAITAETRLDSRAVVVVPWHPYQVLYIEWLEHRLEVLDADIKRRRSTRR